MLKTITAGMLGLSLLSILPVVSAQVLMSGELVATQACPAFKSIRKQDNPDKALLRVGEHYQVIAKNSASATHYLIKLPNAQPNQRWVALDCGTLAGNTTTSQPVSPPTVNAPTGIMPPNTPNTSANQSSYVLAVSWQPAFCETAPQKTECRNQTESRFDATHFTLHGLWPDRVSYCNVPKAQQTSDKNSDWKALPAPQLSRDTQTRLAEVMPGTQSLLERHEWIKHGTCYSASADTYYQDSLHLMEQLNGSAVQTLFASNIGKTLTSAQIRAAFNQSFGTGAGERVRIACKNDGDRRLIVELTLGLKGNLASNPLGSVMLASKPIEIGCPSGVVDPVGIQP